MVIAFLDTSIIVDLLRHYGPAETWLNDQEELGLAHVVWIEVLEGAFNKIEQRRAVAVLQQFELFELTAHDFTWATEALTRYGLSHNFDGYEFNCCCQLPSESPFIYP